MAIPLATFMCGEKRNTVANCFVIASTAYNKGGLARGGEEFPIFDNKRNIFRLKRDPHDSFIIETPRFAGRGLRQLVFNAIPDRWCKGKNQAGATIAPHTQISPTRGRHTDADATVKKCLLKLKMFAPPPAGQRARGMNRLMGPSERGIHPGAKENDSPLRCHCIPRAIPHPQSALRFS